MPIKITSEIKQQQAQARLAELTKQAQATGKGKAVYVGIFETAKYDDGTRVADVARANNFGTVAGNGAFIPPRPFLTGAFKGTAAGRRLPTIYDKAMRKRVNAGEPLPTAHVHALQTLGAWAAGQVQERVSNASEWAQPNAPSTLRYKQDKANRGKGAGEKVTAGEANAPLRDTGVLIRSVTWKVR